MNVNFRCSGFTILLILSSLLGGFEGFAICYVISHEVVYLVVALVFGVLLLSSGALVYHNFKKIGSYVSNGMKLASLVQRSVIREFGDIRTPRGGEREPLVDVINDYNTIRVIAELPGVEMRYINLNCSEKILTISVDTENRKYYKDVELPVAVDSVIGAVRYMNGVLEVILTKIGTEKHERSQLFQSNVD
jgi:HSP20 family molecular chaperone IbpA